MDKESLVFTGYVLRRTDEPDLAGDIIDVDGVTWEGETGHFVLEGLVPPRGVGYTDVVRQPDGIWGETVITDPGFIEVLNPEGLAFNAMGCIHQRDGKHITKVELTGVAIGPRQYVRSRGTEATLQEMPTGPKDAESEEI